MKLNELTLDEDKMKFSNELNSDIWDNETLKPQVYKKLKEIANAFIEYLDIDIKIVDIQFTGSMANYNFNNDSDIDLHIIADFSKYDIDSDLLQDYFNAKKTLFNNNHNINIYGHPVELYIEDSTKPSQSGGKYSILKDEWLIKPEKITIEVDDVIDSPKYLELVDQIMNVLSSEYNSDEANDILNNLYVMRKQGLLSNGELSEENLIFKKLRSNGYIQELKNYINVNYDKTLSLNESFEQDEKYRKLAYKLLRIAENAISSPFEEKRLYNDGQAVFIDISKEVKKTDKIFHTNKKYYLVFTKSSDKNFSFAPSADDKDMYIFFPILPNDSTTMLKDYISENSDEVYKIINKYPKRTKDIKCVREITDFALAILKQYIKDISNHLFNENKNILIHECTHLIDYMRVTDTYKSKKQNIDDIEGIIDYYNRDNEQNAYYQETAFKFDEWAKDKLFDEKHFHSFLDFYYEFIRQYSGSFQYLTEPNKKRLRKRIYNYWRKTYMPPKYEDFKE